MHAQAHAANRRARWNAASNVEDKHRPANVTLAVFACEKVKTGAIAKVLVDVLVQRIVFARVNIDSRRAS